MSLRMGELFAGYGGLGLGVGQVLDVEHAWVADVCKFDKDGQAGHYEPHRGPCAVLAHRFPDVPNLGDVTKVDWSLVEPVDVLTGGSPCQDLSHAGKRAGMTEGTRSNLWVTMREAIATLRPSLVVWENVRGAYSAEADSDLVRDSRLLADTRRRDGEPVLRALGRVLGDLSELGYDAVWHGLRAADVGAPHGRFRVFVVAYPSGDAGRVGRCEAIEHDGSSAPAGNGRSVPDESDRDALRAGPDGSLSLLPTPAVNDMGAAYAPDEWDAWTERMKAAHGNGNGHGKSLNVEAQRLLPTPEASRAGGTAEAHRERKRRSLGRTDPTCTNLDLVAADDATKWGDYAAAIARWEPVIGRPAPAPTMTSKKGNPQLSPRFTEWLMGVADGWITDVPGMTRNDALKLCGNGVVPQQAAAAIRWALARLEDVAA